MDYTVYTVYTVSTNSEKFPDILYSKDVADSNLCIWKKYMFESATSENIGDFFWVCANSESFELNISIKTTQYGRI